MKFHLTIVLGCALILSGCVKLPIESLQLSDSITNEGKRMHEMNVALVNKMFHGKSERIDAFIQDEYTPKFLEEFMMRIPEGVDVEAELPGILKSITPQISLRRDAMQTALEAERIKLIEKLNLDFDKYQEASSELRNLIRSGVNINEERRRAFERLTSLTGGAINLNQVETELDKFVLKAGEVGGNLQSLETNINELSNSINSLLNQ